MYSIGEKHPIYSASIWTWTIELRNELVCPSIKTETTSPQLRAFAYNACKHLGTESSAASSGQLKNN